MKRLKSLVGLAAGLMLAGSMLAAPALAQPPETSTGNNTTDVSVTFSSGGAFDAYFCQVLGSHSPSTSLNLVQAPTLATAGLAQGSLYICYDDSLPTRPAFHVDVSAGAFTGGTSTIPLSGFTIDRVYNVVQHYWGSPASTPPQAADYGDIGQFVNDVYVAQNGTWPKAWSAPNNSFASPHHLQFGYAGVGTDYSYGQFDVSVVIPIGSFGGTYTSTMTLSLYAGENP